MKNKITHVLEEQIPNGYLPAIVATQANKHDSNLSNIPFGFEVHLGLHGLYRVALDNRRLIAACERCVDMRVSDKEMSRED